jgi:hypothetical protein
MENSVLGIPREIFEKLNNPVKTKHESGKEWVHY